MLLMLNGREVEVELDKNADGSKFIASGYYTEGAALDLTDDELDALQEQYDDEINEMYGG